MAQDHLSISGNPNHLEVARGNREVRMKQLERDKETPLHMKCPTPTYVTTLKWALILIVNT